MLSLTRILKAILLGVVLASTIQAQAPTTINSGPFINFDTDPPNTTLLQVLQPILATIQAYFGALTIGDIKFPLLNATINVTQPPPQNISSGGSFVTTRDIFYDKKATEIQNLNTAKAVCAVVGQFALSLNLTNDPVSIARLPQNNQEQCIATYIQLFTNPISPGAGLLFQPPEKFSDGTSFIGSMFSFGLVDQIDRTQLILGLFNYVYNGTVNPKNPLVAFSIVVFGINFKQQAIITLDNLTVAADGSFSVTIDPSPANGRPNHLQTTISSVLLQIRDLPRIAPGSDPNSEITTSVITVSIPPVLQTFLNQTVILLQTIGLVKPTFSLVGIEQLVSQLAVFNDQVYAAFLTIGGIVVWVVQRALALFLLRAPVNTFPPPASYTQLGLESQQILSVAKVSITDTQAFVVTVTVPGKYFAGTVYDNFLFPDFAYQRQISLNNFQAECNPNGTYTLIFAKVDPGYANWVDSEDLNNFVARLTWIGGNPSIVAAFVTPIANLPSVITGTRLNPA